ncbi:hypothetical protein [Pseudoalteromonas piscicida]|uniref:Uncharacterized protein n=1 Tax=Pseudoalteromonas piscicida TaxID=43662 RepID=A0A2A5JW17_PSEO7|nr:hypothetical protein [Pseudoalteromonas piscicida]PCK33673.1 hypothetical protein CEX98_00665 [Pseudoalteromonas piscicida]
MKESFAKFPSQSLIFRVDHQQLDDSCIHPITCPEGHLFAMVFNGSKFEVLFDIALNAISDGYFREAVSSFSASLERFFEFFINYVMYQNLKGNSEFDKAWRSVKNQSERQLGAYIFVYLYKYSSFPCILTQEQSNFRNKVIHKGYIPTKQEAIDFGEVVYTCIMEVIKKIEQGEERQLSEFYNKSLPTITGYECTLTMNPKGISLNSKYKNSKLPEPTRCKPYSLILKSFKLNTEF